MNRNYTRLQTAPYAKRKLETAIRYTLLSGTLLGLMACFLLVRSDLKNLENDFTELSVQVSNEKIKAGEALTVVYEFQHLPQNADQEVEFVAELPKFYSFVPGSLEVISGNAEIALLHPYEGTRRLSLGEIKGQQMKTLRFAVKVNVPEQEQLIEKSFMHEAHFTLNQNRYSSLAPAVAIE